MTAQIKDACTTATQANPVERLVMLHVWIHSHAETGEPYAVDVFDIDGRIEHYVEVVGRVET